MDDLNISEDEARIMEKIRERRRIKNKEKRLKKQKQRLQRLEDGQRVQNLGGHLHLVPNRIIENSPTFPTNEKLDLLNPHQYPAIQDAHVKKQCLDRPYDDDVVQYSDMQGSDFLIQKNVAYPGPRPFLEDIHVFQKSPPGPSKVKSNSTFTRNINELIVHNDPQKIQNRSSECTEMQIYKGNPLDADKPERFSGKHRIIEEAKKMTSLKQGILIDNEFRNATGANKNLINYIPYQLTPKIEEKLIDFLKEIVKLQRKMFAHNKAKAQMKKRYVLGFSQCTRSILGNRAKLLIIAADHKITREEDTLLGEIKKIRDTAIEHNVEVMYAFTKRRLGNLTKTFCLISCMTILNADGIHDQLHHIFKEYNVIKEQAKIKPLEHV